MKNPKCPSCGAPLPREKGISSRIGDLCPGCAALYFHYEAGLFQREFFASLPLCLVPNALFWASILPLEPFLTLDSRIRTVGLAAALVLAAVSTALAAGGVLPLFGKSPFVRGYRESQTDLRGDRHPLLWTARRRSDETPAFGLAVLRFVGVFALIPLGGSLLSILTLFRAFGSFLRRRRNRREILTSGQKCYPDSFFRTFPDPLVPAFLDPDRYPLLLLKIGDRDGEWINEGHLVWKEILYGVLRVPGSAEMVFLRLDSPDGKKIPADPATSRFLREMIASS